ncbi:hypothetical protein D3C72_2024770 [compost metagenome]
MVTSRVRTFKGENSPICAVQMGNTPPIPKPAIKRMILKVSGLSVNPAAAVKMLNSATHIAIIFGRPIRSANVPKKMAPSIVPNNAEPAITPALVASICISAMMAGRAAPTTAKS